MLDSGTVDMNGNQKDTIIGQITARKPNAYRPRGQPKQRLTDRMKENLKMVGVRNAKETAKDEKIGDDLQLFQQWALKFCKKPKKKKKKIVQYII